MGAGGKSRAMAATLSCHFEARRRSKKAIDWTDQFCFLKYCSIFSKGDAPVPLPSPAVRRAIGTSLRNTCYLLECRGMLILLVGKRGQSGCKGSVPQSIEDLHFVRLALIAT